MNNRINELLLAGVLSKNSLLPVEKPPLLLKPEKFYLGVLHDALTPVNVHLFDNLIDVLV